MVSQACETIYLLPKRYAKDSITCDNKIVKRKLANIGQNSTIRANLLIYRRLTSVVMPIETTLKQH